MRYLVLVPNVILAATTGFNVDPVQILNYGLLGVMFVLVATGKLFVTRRELDTANATTARIMEERNAALAEVREKNDLIQSKYVPALESTKAVLDSVATLLPSVASMLATPVPPRKAAR